MANNNFDLPGDSPVTGENGLLLPLWMFWATRIHNAVSTIYMSGTTANRPTKLLWIGRFFYDTTLGKPVWVHAVNPTVWHDGSGAVV